jgi:hypothetical protein
MAYNVTTGNGRLYVFSTDQHDLDDFTETSDPTAVDDDFRTVATWTLDEGEGAAFGIGNSRNPDRAEGYLYFDPQTSTPSDINGRCRFVVLNAANDVVGTISRHRIEQLRSGDATASGRKNRTPYPYQNINADGGEVVGGNGYKIGIQIKTASGSSTFSKSDSTLIAEGYRGTLQN